MARIQSKWYQPFSMTPNRTGTAVAIKIRRWHPAILWLAIRMVEPRALWRPIVWYTIARVYWKAGS